MAEIAAVTAPVPDPKVGKPKPKSEIGFPYYSLEKSIEVARLLHERADGRAQRPQLASLLGYSAVKNGGFLTRLSAVKMFGLVEMLGESVALTDRSKRILSPVRPSDASQAKLDAYMNVALFRRVFEDFDGHTLPAKVGLRNKFENEYKIVPKQVANALRVMYESATTAGLFELHGNRSRMIRPIIIRSDTAARDSDHPDSGTGSSDADEQEQVDRQRGGGGGGGGGGAGDGQHHPLIQGLLMTLPAPGNAWSAQDRVNWLTLAISVFKMIYTGEAGFVSITDHTKESSPLPPN